jgi:hypothetical protein
MKFRMLPGTCPKCQKRPWLQPESSGFHSTTGSSLANPEKSSIRNIQFLFGTKTTFQLGWIAYEQIKA